jgi:DNA-binding IclR family transcriptional regulator
MVGTRFDTATTALVSKLITHAENEVNKYLSKRYDISVFDTTTSVPPLVTTLTETLAEGYSYQRSSMASKKWGSHPRGGT